MASVWSPPGALSPSPRICHLTSSSSNPKGFKKYRKQNVFCYQGDQKPSLYVQEQLGSRRRGFILEMGLTAFSFPAIVSDALAKDDVPEGFRLYTDDENKFKILIPEDWRIGEAQPKGFNSITAFYPGVASNSNVSIVITGLGADFTRMESFGKVESFAETLVSGLDRSWKNPPGVAAKLIDCKASKGMYYVEYTLQNPGETRRYLYSALGMASNGWVNRLFTVTGQFVEEEREKYSSKVEKVVSSFRFI